MRRAAYSISANIAEGFGRYYFNDKIRFYYQARGSATEVQNFILLAQELSFINQDIAYKLMGESEEAIKNINGIIISIEKNKKTK